MILPNYTVFKRFLDIVFSILLFFRGYVMKMEYFPS
jgi:hypothetical protein